MKRTRPGAVFVAIMVIVIGAVGAVVLTAAQATAPVYKPAQRLCVLCDFGVHIEDPSLPQQMGLMADGQDGYIYGTSSSGGKNGVFVNQGTIFRFSTSTGKVDVLYAFDMLDHGFNPMGGLTRAADGTLYGTTYQGGRFHFLLNGKDTLGFGVGVLFKFKPDPAFTAGGQIVPELLHVFRNGNMTGMKQTQCKDLPVKHCFFSPQQRLNAAAGYPLSAPVQASNGEFYGVASKGMNYATGILYKAQPSSDGLGITALCVGGAIFPDDAEPTDQELVDRCMFRGDRGILPVSLTAHPTLPELYGTTTGGAPGAPYGTVFKATLGGLVTVLKNFKDPTEGSQPFGVIIASDRKLYGTTRYGGLIGGGLPSGGGVVYRISPLPTSGFIAASDFEVIRRLNGTTDGGGPVSQLVDVPRIITDPTTGQKQERPVLYGTASGGGENRGVIFRIDATVAGAPPIYQVAYTFPYLWQVAGSSPQSTLIKWQDSKTGLPVLFGTTRGGGIVNYGALFRLTGLDLPPVQQPVYRTVWARTALTKTLTKSFPVAGETQLLQVNVITDIDANQITEDGYLNDNPQGRRGIAIDAFNCRNPHLIQFISRDKYDVLRKAWVAGTYYLPDRYEKNVSYPFSFGDQEGDRRWRVDALQGPPNPYYDENFGAYHAVRANVVSILDAPSFGLAPARPGVAPNYVEGAPERWRASFRDFVICNCKPLVEIRWTREQEVKFHPDTNTWQHEFPVYKDVSIEAAPATALDWINLQLQGDSAGKQYPLLP
jgi:hypothetical protein